jgi:hypothetical protein
MPLFEFLAKPPVSTMYLMGMGAVCAFMSPIIIYLCIAFSFAVFLSATIEIAFAVMIFTFLVIFFYARLAPKESILILWMFFAFYFRIPYIIPVICGLYFGLTSIIPITIGVFAWSFTPVITSLIPAQAEAVSFASIDIMELPKTFLEVFSTLGGALFTDTSWIFTAFVFAVVVIIVHFLSTQEINYASQISIVLGVMISIISFVIIGFVTGDSSSLLNVLLMSIPTIFICLAINFFDVALDYRKSDRVTFEDDDNFYYVKIVPKVQLMDPEPKVVQERKRPSFPEKQTRPIREAQGREIDRRPERLERLERPERPERIDRPERLERLERPERPERIGRPDQPARIDRPNRPVMQQRPLRPYPGADENGKKNL